jgi:glycosyltransferase involved in cell wall biosynthesis
VVAHPERVRTILNGVDTELFAPRPDDGSLHRELGLLPSRPIIGSIGRLEFIKGYDIVVEAFRELGSRGPGAESPALVIAGDGSASGELHTRIRRHGLEGDVKLLGWRSDLLRLYSGFTLFTMGSRSEGTSVSLLEAMSVGLCPVVTDVGGNRAVLGPALAHRLVPPEDPIALAAAWRQALADPAGRASDGAAGRRRVEQAYAQSTMIRAYEALYAEESL